MSLDAVLAETVAREVERRIAEVQRPIYVSQRTCLAVLGIQAHDFLRACRAGHWPSFAERRLRYARVADVVEVVEKHPVRQAAQDEARLLRLVGARRVAP